MSKNSKKNWSDEELNYIQENHLNPMMTIPMMAKALGVSKTAMSRQIDKMGLKDAYNLAHNRKNVTTVWTEEKEQFLKDNAHQMSYREIAKELGISISAIGTKCNKLGLKSKYVKEQYWSEDEVNYLTENYDKVSMAQLCKHLSRSESSIYGKLSSLNLTRNPLFRNWTSEEVEFLKENFGSMDYKELGERLNRTPHSVHTKASELKLAKTSLKRVKLKEDDVKFIIENYLLYTDTQLGQMFGVSDQAISEVRKQHGLMKTGNEVKGCTYIEQAIKDILDELGVSYVFNEYLGDYKPDFQIVDKNILIEVHGDYFHCNPYKYPEGPINDSQVKHIVRDYYKQCYYLSRGYEILVIWEDEIKNDLNSVKSKVKSAVLDGNT